MCQISLSFFSAKLLHSKIWWTVKIHWECSRFGDDLISKYMNGSDVYDRCRHDKIQFHPSYTACRKTGNLPEPAWENEACLQLHHSNNLAKWEEKKNPYWLIQSVQGTPSLIRGISEADLAADFSLPLTCIWLRTEHKIISLLAKKPTTKQNNNNVVLQFSKMILCVCVCVCVCVC